MRLTDIGGGLPPVSAISLGSWNTFSRITFEENLTLIERAMDLGVNLFDVGYYWDKPHTELIFARVLQVLARPRDSYMVAEKLWLWDYPQQSFLDQLKGSLLRLGLDHVDLVMVSRPLPEMDFDAFCDEVVDLVDRGLARAWGVTNWDPEQIAHAQARLGAAGRPTPRLVQLQYNLARRGIVETPGYDALFAAGDIHLCAAHTMEGGIIAGHLNRDRVNPSDMAAGVVPNERNIARDAGGIRETIRENQALLETIAKRFDATPAQIAIATVLANPGVGTALIGVTKVSDLEDDIGAIRLVSERRAELLEAVEPLRLDGVAHPKRFNPHNDE
ncbi:aldo/keto reductase [Sphingomonas sp. AOB5]|uniref:aldo/keto reductase n=1 Tax=Sphingomonas sp. AOB5 TaxID=3034017 RepID=UPI0023FA3469|nr:aldo/keto reductase [Sphingomonas sp. AOB5]MDF7776446.1 aldo/keto reductase [Sphingomonas sp. AOB5]